MVQKQGQTKGIKSSKKEEREKKQVEFWYRRPKNVQKYIMNWTSLQKHLFFELFAQIRLC
jgi:hypothetical protein